MAGGGIGEAALIGAAFGGGRALMTGEDPLKAALLGSVTGGAMSGLTSALGAGAAATGGVGATGSVAKDAATNQVLASQVPGTAGVSAFTDTATAAIPQVSSQGLNAVSGTGLTAGMGPGGMPEFGMNVNKAMNDTGLLGSIGGYDNLAINRAMAPDFSAGINQLVPQAAPQTVAPVVQAPISSSVQPVTTTFDPLTKSGQALSDNSATNLLGDRGFDVRDFTGKDTLLAKAANAYEKQGLGGQAMYAGLGGMGYGAYKQSQIEPEKPKKEKEDKTLAGYDRESYIPYEAPRPDPYPQAQYVDYFNYAKEGGVMKSYAEGGIAALANGMGGNSNFPQGRLDQTQYATPTQMPTSAEVVNADYAQKTDPYSGSPIGMAEGGVAGYADGGQVYYDSYSGQYYTNPNKASVNPMYGIMGGPMASLYGGLGFNTDAYLNPNSRTYNTRDAENYRNKLTWLGDPFAKQQQVEAPAPVMNRYQASYKQQAPVQSYSGPQGGMAPNYSLGNSMPLLAKTNPAAAQAVSGMAEGGIAGYNLGGYASGGNPRLLKGPGDGMSDNIPATIGDRQPARLADGEFVVPADVVSHLGNGSTDAGAKLLYRMMDKVRKARTGSKKQGKQIKPAKFLPA